MRWSSFSPVRSAKRPAPALLGFKRCRGEPSLPSARAWSSSSTGGGSPPQQQQPAGGGLRRVLIGLFGEMNAGKSTVMNALTQQATAIVDATPGTTADVKAALMQLHGLGPCKVLDTAGVDDVGELGGKKRAKALQALKEVDLAVMVIDPATKRGAGPAAAAAQAREERGSGSDGLSLLASMVKEVGRRGRKAMLVFNVRGGSGGLAGEGLRAAVSAIEEGIMRQAQAPVGTLLPSFTADFHDPHQQPGKRLGLHVVQHLRQAEPPVDLVPPTYHDKVVFLNIPMDAETPEGRLLRPQSMVQEYCLRHFVPTLAHRMDLTKARSSDPSVVEAERQRFLRLLRLLPPGSLVMTDSQAIDVVHPWTQATGYDVTTFSVAMVHLNSGGRLQDYVDGIAALATLSEGDRVLVAEACNHVRIPEQCDDIGLVQIPRRLRQLLPGLSLQLSHAYGREFSDQLSTYRLVVHCGACMIDSQKLRARMEDCRDAQVPMTNYGLLLSFAASPDAFLRVIRPWGVQVPDSVMALLQRMREAAGRVSSPSGMMMEGQRHHDSACALGMAPR